METETKPKSKEEIFSSHKFEWVKTERSGDVCEFDHFEGEGEEFTCFTDNTRIRTELIGDVVLMHLFSNEIIGKELLNPEKNILGVETVVHTAQIQPRKAQSSQDPVISILEKTKKRTEKMNLTLNVKIPSPEIYLVIRENFENVDDILLENVMAQIQQNSMKEAVRRELQNIYSQKKKSKQ